MERTLKCLRFELHRSARMVAICIGFYALFFILFLVMELTARRGMDGNYYNYYFFTVAVFFIFAAVAFPYGGLSNSLLLFSNTRRAIFAAGVLNAAVLAAGLAVLSVISDLFNPWLNGMLHFKSMQFLTLIYPGVAETGAGILLWLFFYFAALLALAGLGLVYGTLQYRFGKRFTIVFWVGFGMLCGVVPGIVVSLFPAQARWAASAFFAVGRTSSLPLASLHLLILALVCTGIAWLISRRQEQRVSEG